jgi:hypothetical protein
VRIPSAIALFAIFQTVLAAGCGGMVLRGSDTNPISFESGELRSNEAIPLAELDLACRDAFETLGYEEIETRQEDGRIILTARTAGGEPVELQLAPKSSKRTELRIRIGVLGNEPQSRLVLEQIHQSL